MRVAKVLMEIHTMEDSAEVIGKTIQAHLKDHFMHVIVEDVQIVTKDHKHTDNVCSGKRR